MFSGNNLYGKSFNYAFAYDMSEDVGNSDGFDVFFLENEQEESAFICDLVNANFLNVDTCIIWANYILFESTYDIEWYKVKIQNNLNGTVKLEMEITSKDRLVELLWETLIDIPCDENNFLEYGWFIFEAGTSSEEIWGWFNKHHSKGVHYLLYEYESEV